MRVKITAPNLDRTIATLDRAAHMFDDVTPLMRQAAGIMLTAADESFENERTPDGSKWKQLAESTARAFVTRGGQRRGYHPILRVSGQLAASITPDYGPHYAQVGTNKVYAAIQQFGGFAGRQLATLIPARAYIGLGRNHLAQIEQAAVDFMAAKVGD